MAASTDSAADARWLARAIDLATENVAAGGGPFGAVIVRDGELVAEGQNRVTRDLDPTAHAEVRLKAPNKHHFVVDLSPFELENPGEVFIAADRPYGLIEATVLRDDAPPAGDAWRISAGLA